MKFIRSILLVVFTTICSTAFAQSPVKAGLSIGPQFMSFSNDVSSTGFGFTAFGDYILNDIMSVGLEVGYGAVSIEGSKLSFIPVMGSFKYHFELKNKQLHPYAKGNFGFISVQYDEGIHDGTSVQNSVTRIGIGLGGGIIYDIDERLGLFGELSYKTVSGFNDFGVNFGVIYSFE
ncbi:outer membrane beta-barrel protein [Flammeovirga sp. OC4]|uniref:outer membrane beta-barrel protein n=1 Tax=Flammeovirga sp. OC4 TaxID=1382345 RepID=UPI0005C5D371|nr:outer membrane beta-barrel protein [Flammeovirga sp. OC4]